MASDKRAHTCPSLAHECFAHLSNRARAKCFVGGGLVPRTSAVLAGEWLRSPFDRGRGECYFTEKRLSGRAQEQVNFLFSGRAIVLLYGEGKGMRVLLVEECVRFRRVGTRTIEGLVCKQTSACALLEQGRERRTILRTIEGVLFQETERISIVSDDFCALVGRG